MEINHVNEQYMTVYSDHHEHKYLSCETKYTEIN